MSSNNLIAKRSESDEKGRKRVINGSVLSIDTRSQFRDRVRRVPEITFTARGRAATASKSASDESGHPASAAAGDDHDIAMDRGSFKDGDMDARSEPTLPSEELSLCQYSGLTRLHDIPLN